MSEKRTTTAWVWARRLVAGGIIALGAVLSVALISSGVVSPLGQVASQLVVVSFLATGLLLMERLPEHRVSQIMYAFGAGLGLLQLGDAYVRLPAVLPGVHLAATLFNHGELVLFPLLAALFIVFPDGTAISPRWRWLPIGTSSAAAIAFVAFVLNPGQLTYYTQFDNILGVDGFPGSAIGDPAYALVAAGVTASATALIVRWRRGAPLVRAQLKWISLAALAIGMNLMAGTVLGRDTMSEVALQLMPLVGIALPLSVGIAITRYRLFEIDRLFSRALAWAIVSGALVALFAGAILVLQGFLGGITQGDTLAVAASTLVAAAAFQPLRRRVQGIVDRRFNRTGATAQQAIDAFGSRLRDQVDLVEVDRGIRGAVDAAVAPSSTGLWLRKTAERRA